MSVEERELLAVQSPEEVRPSPVGAPDHVLEVAGLSKRFGGLSAVDDVSFKVGRGEIYGIIGSNGAGKSTLLSLISGVHRPSAGAIHLDGVEIGGASPARIARLGVGRAHQVPRPFRQMSVREHADVAARVHRLGRRARKARVADVLERTGLASKAERRASDLGLLDLKRLGVARALALDPKLLLLDEIAAGLVGAEIDEAVELVASTRESGVTVVMVEHVQALIRRLADRVLVLEWGRVLTEGTPADVAADPAVIEAYLGSDGARIGRPTSPVAASSPPAPAERPAPILSVRRLDVRYGALPALRSCSLDVGAGEIVAVVGANGAGKTTLAKAVTGLVPVTGGTVELDGHDVTRLAPHRRVRQGIAICQEGRRLFQELTVDENLAVAARATGRSGATPAERIDDVFAVFPEIARHRRALAGTLSGGQQQMVAIGRALVTEPLLVVFDELSLGLAPKITERLLDALPGIRDRGSSVLLIEQNIFQALARADHVYVLDRGVVSFSGRPSDLADDERLRAVYFGHSTPADPDRDETDRHHTNGNVTNVTSTEEGNP